MTTTAKCGYMSMRGCDWNGPLSNAEQNGALDGRKSWIPVTFPLCILSQPATHIMASHECMTRIAEK